MQHLRELLQRHNLKATHQRMVILLAARSQKNHPTVEQIYEIVRTHNPSLSIGTVYKTLASLESAGLLRKIESLDGQLRYDSKTEDHHHIYCADTQEILDFEDAELTDLLEQYMRKKSIHNLTVQHMSLHITGTRTSPDEGVFIQ
jgi:Fur family peroxide stress response transcriptional regulator